MAEIINLRTARKAKKRADKEGRAADNRAYYGLTKAQKAAAKAERDQQAKTLDGKKQDSSAPKDPESQTPGPKP